MPIREALGRDLRTTLIAVVAATVVAGPSAAAAAYVANADKVDNKHAVGFGATVDQRKGKLVATNTTTGLLPNNIIAKAPDSNLLDGLDSTAFLRANGMAADADKIDGHDLGALLTRQASAEFGDPDNEPLETLTEVVTDIAQVSITAPGPGKIQVDGHTVLLADPSPSEYAFVRLSIGTTADAHNPSPAGSAYWDIPAVDAFSDGLHRTTIPTTRTFSVTQAGTYTYYIVGEGSGASSEDPDGPLHYTTQVNAQYFPTP